MRGCLNNNLTKAVVIQKQTLNGVINCQLKTKKCINSPVFLYSIMQSSLVLDISCIHIGAVLQQKLAQVQALHRVYETGAPVIVGSVYVGAVFHEVLHDLQVGHEAGAAHRGRARVRHGVDVGPQPDQQLDDRQLAGDGGAPQRRDVVNGSENAAAGEFISFMVCVWHEGVGGSFKINYAIQF